MLQNGPRLPGVRCMLSYADYWIGEPGNKVRLQSEEDRARTATNRGERVRCSYFGWRLKKS